MELNIFIYLLVIQQWIGITTSHQTQKDLLFNDPMLHKIGFYRLVILELGQAPYHLNHHYHPRRLAMNLAVYLSGRHGTPFRRQM
jgi:hypothetical protein